MSVSLAVETEEKVYYTKLCRLLYNGGTLAVRKVFDVLVPSESLASVLKTNRHLLQRLKKPTGRVLSQDQWNQLYPASGASPKSDDFDITLLFVLLRNICGLTPPATGWDALPPTTDTSRESNLVRIKYYRNKVAAHCSKAEVDSTQFANYWSDISGALVALGLKQDDIDNLKTSPLGQKNYNQLVKEWDLTDKEIKSQLESLKVNIDSRTSQMMSDIANIKNTLKRKYNEIDRLALRDFNKVVETLCKVCHPKTREWLINYVKLRVNHDHCVVIQARPGMGKSVVAAKLCQEFKNKDVLGGCHFFKHDNSLLNNPRLMLQSVARQLCDAYPEYRDILDRTLSRDHGKYISELTCKELWTLLFEEPCSKLKSKCHYVIVIDALDECCNELKKDLFTTLNQISTLPPWLRFVLTTRPPPSISSLDSIGYSVVIDPKDSNNTEDLKTYMADKLGNLTSVELQKLINMTDGLFLVAYFVIDLLTKSDINSISEAVEQFPKENGIASIYEDWFSRLIKALSPHIHSETGFYDMLKAVVTAEYPIEKTMFYSILGLKEEPRGPTKREWKEAINLLHQLFPVENDHVFAFHKTVIDWLTSEVHDHDFNVKGCDCSGLANECYERVLALKQNVKEIVKLDKPPSLTGCDAYALSYVYKYMDGSKGFSKVKRTEVENDGYILCLQSFLGAQIEYNDDDVYSHSFFQEDFQNVIHYLFVTYLRNPTGNMYPTFAQILAFTYQALVMEKGTNKEILDYFKESRVPYIERKTECISAESVEYVVCNREVVVVQFVDGFSVLHKYQLDGSLVKELSLGKRISKSKSDIEIVDAASLEIKATYQFSSAVQSCHAFGCYPWYIVLRCEDDMVYVIDVETGKSVVQPTAIHQNDEIVNVSKEGHIVIARRSFECDNGTSSSSSSGSSSENDQYTVDEEMWLEGNSDASLSLCSYQAISEKMSLSPQVDRCRKCACMQMSRKRKRITCFSDDSELLAFENDDCITIVRTSDGSLYRSVSLCCYGRTGWVIHDLFVSKERMFVLMEKSNDRIVLFIKFGENECDTALEHIFFLGEKEMLISHLKFCKVLVSEDKVSFTTICSPIPTSYSFIDTYTLADSPCHM